MIANAKHSHRAFPQRYSTLLFCALLFCGGPATPRPMPPPGMARGFDPGPFMFANGLALNGAEDALFVIESNANRIRRVEIRRDGKARETSIFCEGLANLPDGMTFDAHENLDVDCFGLNRIYAVDPQGRVEFVCEDTENATMSVPTNCAFGGKNFDQLYFVCMGASSIAVLDLKTRSQPLYAYKDRLAAGGAVRHG